MERVSLKLILRNFIHILKFQKYFYHSLNSLKLKICSISKFVKKPIKDNMQFAHQIFVYVCIRLFLSYTFIRSTHDLFFFNINSLVKFLFSCLNFENIYHK